LRTNLALESALPSVPRRLRVVQAMACLSVACIALQGARESMVPALALEHGLFPAANGPVGTPASQAVVDFGISAPGVAPIEVIVQRNDTLDLIFHRLRISLTDLANVRALAGVRTMLDHLNPGERLRVLQRDGVLLGMTRHVSLTQQLEVRRTEAG